jgi:hypothetical protein
MPGVALAVVVGRHSDWRVWVDDQPSNSAPPGTVRLMDFGASKRDAWIRDLGRFYVQQWLDGSDLRAAFFAGYGRNPTDADHALLRCYLS